MWIWESLFSLIPICSASSSREKRKFAAEEERKEAKRPNFCRVFPFVSFGRPRDLTWPLRRWRSSAATRTLLGPAGARRADPRGWTSARRGWWASAGRPARPSSRRPGPRGCPRVGAGAGRAAQPGGHAGRGDGGGTTGQALYHCTNAFNSVTYNGVRANTVWPL